MMALLIALDTLANLCVIYIGVRYILTDIAAMKRGEDWWSAPLSR